MNNSLTKSGKVAKTGIEEAEKNSDPRRWE